MKWVKLKWCAWQTTITLSTALALLLSYPRAEKKRGKPLRAWDREAKCSCCLSSSISGPGSPTSGSCRERKWLEVMLSPDQGCGWVNILCIQQGPSLALPPPSMSSFTWHLVHRVNWFLSLSVKDVTCSLPYAARCIEGVWQFSWWTGNVVRLSLMQHLHPITSVLSVMSPWHVNSTIHFLLSVWTSHSASLLRHLLNL